VWSRSAVSTLNPTALTEPAYRTTTTASIEPWIFELFGSDLVVPQRAFNLATHMRNRAEVYRRRRNEVQERRDHRCTTPNVNPSEEHLRPNAVPCGQTGVARAVDAATFVETSNCVRASQSGNPNGWPRSPPKHAGEPRADRGWHAG
jgi:hypothetical protein